METHAHHLQSRYKRKLDDETDSDYETTTTEDTVSEDTDYEDLYAEEIKKLQQEVEYWKQIAKASQDSLRSLAQSQKPKPLLERRTSAFVPPRTVSPKPEPVMQRIVDNRRIDEAMDDAMSE